MAGFDYPAGTELVGDDKKPTMGWEAVFGRWHLIILTGQESGTTAQRPTSQLWIGRQYYDTTLNKPVYVSAVRPAVWRDASSAVV